MTGVVGPFGACSLALGAALFLGCAALAQEEFDGPIRRTWNFHGDRAGAGPDDFHASSTGGGAPGRWLVRSVKGAPSGSKVLAQLDADAAPKRWLVAVVDDSAHRDVSLSVRCMPVSGNLDQACGLALRYKDDRNYYVARVSALEQMATLLVMKDGKRAKLAEAGCEAAAGEWGELRVDARGDNFAVFWNGKQLLDCSDSTSRYRGKIGVWTRADTVAYFDDLTADPLGK